MKGVISEKDFEEHIRTIIINEILKDNPDLILLSNKKVVDILICRNVKPTLFFIEVKYHKHNHGRLGFGQSKGAGFQPEILLKRPVFFETNLMWIIGSEESEHYYILNNQQISNYLQGGKVAQKFNGIQKRVFIEEKGKNRKELIELIKSWVKS